MRLFKGLIIVTSVYRRHNDFPWRMKRYAKNKLASIDLESDLRLIWGKNSHTDIPRLREGHVGAQVGRLCVTWFQRAFLPTRLPSAKCSGARLMVWFIGDCLARAIFTAGTIQNCHMLYYNECGLAGEWVRVCSCVCVCVWKGVGRKQAMYAF